MGENADPLLESPKRFDVPPFPGVREDCERCGRGYRRLRPFVFPRLCGSCCRPESVSGEEASA